MPRHHTGHGETPSHPELAMHHYDPASKETIFTCPAGQGPSVFLHGQFLGGKLERIPMHRGPQGWQANVALPAGFYAYQFEINGRRIRDESSGSIKLRGPQVEDGTWSLAVVPNWLRRVPA